MKNQKSAISVLLFSIYALVLFHSSIPHFHTDSSTTMEVEEKEGHAHDHSGHHHHGHLAKNGETLFDYLLNLLSDFGHKDQGEKHLEELVTEKNVHQTKLFKQVLTYDFEILFQSIYCEMISSRELAEIYIRPPILYEQLRSSSESLRGPPSI